MLSLETNVLFWNPDIRYEDLKGTTALFPDCHQLFVHVKLLNRVCLKELKVVNVIGNVIATGRESGKHT